jgi:hypothetical protein
MPLITEVMPRITEDMPKTEVMPLITEVMLITEVVPLITEVMPPIAVRSMRIASRNSEQKWDFSGKKMGLFGIYAANKGQVDGRKVAQSLQKF